MVWCVVFRVNTEGVRMLSLLREAGLFLRALFPGGLPHVNTVQSNEVMHSQ